MSDDSTAKTVKQAKQDTRKSVRAAIARMSEQQRTNAAISTLTVLTGSREWKKSDCILAYLAFGTELNADPVVSAALAEGKAVFVPRVDGSRMSFHRIVSADGPFERGVFGIRQPPADNEEWKLSTTSGTTLVLVPGMAFDTHGRRLGRGAAYYDRFIAGCRSALKSETRGNPEILFIAYAYSVQVVGEVPVESHDEKVEGIITENGLIPIQISKN